MWDDLVLLKVWEVFEQLISTLTSADSHGENQLHLGTPSSGDALYKRAQCDAEIDHMNVEEHWNLSLTAASRLMSQTSFLFHLWSFELILKSGTFLSHRKTFASKETFFQLLLKKSNQSYFQTVLMSKLSNNISPLSFSNRHKRLCRDALSLQVTLMSTHPWK